MTTVKHKSSEANKTFQLKGGLFTLTVLHLLDTDLGVLTAQLAALVKQTPKFFQHMPLVLDLQKLVDSKNKIDFAELLVCLRERGIIPIGVRGGSSAQHDAAMSAGLAILPNTKVDLVETTAALTTGRPAKAKSVDNLPEIASAAIAANTSKIITQPVRSGQQVYARNADLVVLATVSAGAELIADGNIHVYGALRGRALAGVSGNQQARIFCQTLAAELVAIAGHYWVSEDLQKSPVKQSVHIYLENDRLQIGTL